MSRHGLQCMDSDAGRSLHGNHLQRLGSGKGAWLPRLGHIRSRDFAAANSASVSMPALRSSASRESWSASSLPPPGGGAAGGGASRAGVPVARSRPGNGSEQPWPAGSGKWHERFLLSVVPVQLVVTPSASSARTASSSRDPGLQGRHTS